MEPEKPPAAETDKPDDRRRAQRHRTLKAAKLLPMEGWAATDGVVRDQSETGARISVGKPETVPDEFRLVVVKEATIQPCTVRWRASEQMGVEYSGDPKPAPPRKL
jgi:hypothetical protein